MPSIEKQINKALTRMQYAYDYIDSIYERLGGAHAKLQSAYTKRDQLEIVFNRALLCGVNILTQDQYDRHITNLNQNIISANIEYNNAKLEYENAMNYIDELHDRVMDMMDQVIEPISRG